MSSPQLSIQSGRASRLAGRSIAQYLLHRLFEAGARHIFGVPGDYVLRFYEQIGHSPVQHIGTTREDTAAFAADGYARCQGLGAVAVTYGVGALNVVNAVAGAHAESSPVVIISGAPGVEEQRHDPLLHHRFGPFTFQREIFERITCGTFVLDDPVIAARQIDRAVAAARASRHPVYIELPRDMVDCPAGSISHEPVADSESDPAALDEAVAEAAALLQRAQSPVLIAGVEVHRRSLQDALVRLVERARLPVAATLTGKSVVAERHPAYVGVYEGAMSEHSARDAVERSDCVLMVGVTLNDVDTGIYTARLDADRLIRASHGEVIVHHHRYQRVQAGDFLRALTERLTAPQRPWQDSLPGPQAPGFPISRRPMSIGRLIGRLNNALTPQMTVVSDTGDCLFASLELRVHERTEYLASGFYATMGFAVPAALGAQVARPDRRALILVGDGAFQMTGTELSTHVRLGLAPIVVVFNNRGYSTERFILDGPFNNIPNWQYHRLGELCGPLYGFEALTEEDFETALDHALAHADRPSLINVHLDPREPSPAMQRLTSHLQRQV